jgi:TonB family protein
LKTATLLLTFFISLNLSGQKDTVIYYSGLGRIVGPDSTAQFYEKVTKKAGKKYLSTTASRQTGKWAVLYETNIKMETDSSLTISSRSLINPETARIFHKTNGGYFIKDYIGSVLAQEGFSKLMFPLVKYGHWRSYDTSTGSLKAEEAYLENQLISNRYWINESEFIEDVFYLADKVPAFKGGDTTLMNFINEHGRYPKYAFNHNIEGIVTVRLIVMKDGSVRGIELFKKGNRFLDLEALRVIKSIPETWNPGEIENKKVNMLITVPVTFQISKFNYP